MGLEEEEWGVLRDGTKVQGVGERAGFDISIHIGSYHLCSKHPCPFSICGHTPPKLMAYVQGDQHRQPKGLWRGK